MKPMRTVLLLVLILSIVPLPASAQDGSDPAPDGWKKKVTEAKALEDETERRDALLALVREALGSLEVRASGNTHADQVHPEDNQPAPVVNFDARLNEKTTYATDGRRLETSPAYYFVAKGRGYAVMGPGALNPRSPIFTRMSAEHELFHARRHVGDPRPIVDRELETWTHMFVTFFHEVIPFKQRWAPLVSNYENADAGEQQATLEKLTSYYRAPPESAANAAARAGLRAAFDEWLGRRKKDEATASSKLVADLEKALVVAAPSR